MLKWIVILALIIAGSFIVFSKTKKNKKASFAVLENKPFVIIIPSYNNGEWVKKNVRSVFEQQYDTFRVIFIDDASTDSTLLQAQALALEYHHLQGKVTFIHNETNRGAAENIYRAVHSCKKEEIVLLLDGDDFLAHDRVLQRLNALYANPQVWLTYGSYIEYPNYGYTVANFARKVPLSVLKKGAIRAYCKKHWSLSHLRSFYAGLFQQIKREDFLFQGAYLDAASDLAFMIPMVEMAGEHAHFVDEVLYLYNRANPLNDHKVKAARQREMVNYILQNPVYAQLERL